MMRHRFTIGAVAFAFALGAGQALAQENPRSGPGSRSSSGGERTGSSAVPRGGGSESSGAPSGGSSGGGMSGGSSMGSSSSPSAPSSSGSSGRASAWERAPRRGSDDQSTGRRAVPRGGSASSGSTSRETGSATAPARTGSTSTDRRAVPSSNRPRGDNPVAGVAVERRNVPLSPRDVYYIYRPYYNPYGFYGSGFGYGLGYLYYDPFWYGGFGYDPYGYGLGGYGGYGGYGSYGSGGYGSYGSGGYSQTSRDSGSLRLKVKPRDAQVFVDGYFVGVVDSFDGAFQKLTLDGGGHRVEIKADGYEAVQFEILITPGETVTYKGEMQPIK